VRGERHISLLRHVFAALHPALRRRFVVWAAQALGQSMDVGYVHITAAVDLVLNGQVGALAQLKAGLQLRIDYEQIVIEYEGEPDTDEFPLVPVDVEFPVTFPCEIALNDGWVFNALLTPVKEADMVRIAIPEGSGVVLRGRRRGDRFPSSNDPHASAGIGVTHKLNEWMIDHKVPRHLRERLPLIVVDGQVAAVWWNGWTVSRFFAPKHETKYIHYFVIKRIYHENHLKA
jgi:tRNA(Ile)-lysidine synthase